MKYIILVLLICTSCAKERDYLIDRTFIHYVDCDIAKDRGDSTWFKISKEFFIKSFSELNSKEKKSLEQKIDNYHNQTKEEIDKYLNR